MILFLIAAIGKNRELGRNNGLLWNLPDDLQYFREYTKEKTLIMGKSTFLSIGKPLPKRKNIVLTSDPHFSFPGVDSTLSLESALYFSRNLRYPPCIIGGAKVYKKALPYVTELCLTFVDATCSDADTFFPVVDFSKWTEVSRQHFSKDNRNEEAFDIVRFVRKHNR